MFTTFNTESYYDTVQINNGSTTQTFSGDSINGYYNGDGAYIGTSIPGPVTDTTITVKFSSDYSVTRRGFLATVCCSASITTDVTGE